jgi:uncharacterized protein YdcH (DUF465 family)
MDKHDLHHEFPEYEESIHQLKTEDKHFKKMFDEYHLVNKDIHRIETNEIFTDEEIKELKVKRLQLKDKLLKMLKNEE